MSADAPVLIVVTLRGGVDALNVLVPYRDDDYRRLRPTLAIPPPGKAKNAAIDLDGFFGLHPSLAPLVPLYERGQLALVQAVGWPGVSHSHFQAWEEIEAGALGEDRPSSGWLARAVSLASRGDRSPLSAVAFGETMPRLLTGALGATVLSTLRDFRLATAPGRSAEFAAALRLLHTHAALPVGSAGLETLDALASVERITDGAPAPIDSNFVRQLREVLSLVRADVGLRAASVELSGWDFHFAEGGSSGAMAALLAELARGLAEFAREAGEHWNRVVVVAISEFGRRAAENGSGGTDHGQAGVVFVGGGGVRGGRILGEWPGLSERNLVPPGDVAITTDFRDVLLEVLPYPALRDRERIFPRYRKSRELGLLRDARSERG